MDELTPFLKIMFQYNTNQATTKSFFESLFLFADVNYVIGFEVGG